MYDADEMEEYNYYEEEEEVEGRDDEMALADTPGFMQPRVKSYVLLL